MVEREFRGAEDIHFPAPCQGSAMTYNCTKKNIMTPFSSMKLLLLLEMEAFREASQYRFLEAQSLLSSHRLTSV